MSAGNLAFPLLLVGGLFLLSRRQGGGMGGPGGNNPMNFGKSKAKFQMEPNTGITFADVAGVEEAKADFIEVRITVSVFNGPLLVCLPGGHQADSGYKHGAPPLACSCLCEVLGPSAGVFVLSMLPSISLASVKCVLVIWQQSIMVCIVCFRWWNS